MLNDITLGQYIPGNSFLHKLDPRIKLIISLLLILEVFLINNIRGYLILTALTLLLIFISKVSPIYFLTAIRSLWLFILLTLVINLFFTGETKLLAAGPVSITVEGLISGLSIISKFIFLLIFTALLTYTTSPISLTDAVAFFMKPLKILKIPVNEFVLMMTIGLRFIPVIFEEAQKIKKAQIARGVDFGGWNPFKIGLNYLTLIIPLLAGCFRRADELARAMEARCYRPGEERTRLNNFVIKKYDYTAVLIGIFLIGLLYFIRS